MNKDSVPLLLDSASFGSWYGGTSRGGLLRCPILRTRRMALTAPGFWMSARLSVGRLELGRHNLRFGRENEGTTAGILAWVCSYEALDSIGTSIYIKDGGEKRGLLSVWLWKVKG